MQRSRSSRGPPREPPTREALILRALHQEEGASREEKHAEGRVHYDASVLSLSFPLFITPQTLCPPAFQRPPQPLPRPRAASGKIPYPKIGVRPRYRKSSHRAFLCTVKPNHPSAHSPSPRHNGANRDAHPASPAQQWASPAQQWAGPAQHGASPAQQWARPAQQWARPAQRWAGPAQQWARPAQWWAGPAQPQFLPALQRSRSFYRPRKAVPETGHGRQRPPVFTHPRHENRPL